MDVLRVSMTMALDTKNSPGKKMNVYRFGCFFSLIDRHIFFRGSRDMS